MDIEVYEIYFSVRYLDKPPKFYCTDIYLTDRHFEKQDQKSKEEVIMRESLFIISDRFPLSFGASIRLLKYRPAQKNMLLACRKRS